MGGIANNPQVQNAINTRPQLPPGVQMPTGLPSSGQPPLNDPLNRGGMPFQGFNPANTAGPGAMPPPMQVQPGTGNPQLDAFKRMFLGQQQPFNSNFLPYEGPDPNQTVPMPPPGTIAYNTYQQTGRLPTYGEISRPMVGPARPRPNVMQPGPNVMPQPQPPQQRGLGGLQLDRFRRRLG